MYFPGKSISPLLKEVSAFFGTDTFCISVPLSSRLNMFVLTAGFRTLKEYLNNGYLFCPKVLINSRRNSSAFDGDI